MAAPDAATGQAGSLTRFQRPKPLADRVVKAGLASIVLKYHHPPPAVFSSRIVCLSPVSSGGKEGLGDGMDGVAETVDVTDAAPACTANPCWPR